MADSVFGGGEKKPAADDGVFAGASKPVETSGGVFSGAAEKKESATAEAPVMPEAAPTTGEMSAFGTGGVIAAKKPFPWKRVLQIGIPAVAVLALAGGALAYFLVQNSDDKIIGDALTNMLKDNDVKVNGEALVSNINSDGDKVNVKFGVTARTDEAGKNSEMSAELMVRPTIASVEALDGSKEFGGTLNVAYVNESIFAKMDYLKVLDQVVSAVATSDEEVEWPEEITRYNNRWLMVSNDTLANFMDSENEDLQACLQERVVSLRGNKKAGRELYGILTTVVKFERASKEGGIATYNVKPSDVLSDYYNFLVQVRDSEIVKGFAECGNNYQEGFADDFKEMLDGQIKAYEEMSDADRENSQKALRDVLKEIPTVTVQISTKTRRFTNVTVKGSVDDIKIDLKLDIESKRDKNANIEAPSDYLELTESDLNGLGDLDLDGIFNAGSVSAQRNAVDTVLAQYMAYKANNGGNLPTLSIDYNGRVSASDAFFTQYLNNENNWNSDFTLRLLNDDDSKDFPGIYSSMTDSGPFYLQDSTDSGYNSIRYSRYGDSNGDIWVIYGAVCSDTTTNNIVKRASGSNAVAVMTYLGDSAYHCAD
jgi:hypothetical protein